MSMIKSQQLIHIVLCRNGKVGWVGKGIEDPDLVDLIFLHNMWVLPLTTCSNFNKFYVLFYSSKPSIHLFITCIYPSPQTWKNAGTIPYKHYIIILALSSRSPLSVRWELCHGPWRHITNNLLRHSSFYMQNRITRNRQTNDGWKFDCGNRFCGILFQACLTRHDPWHYTMWEPIYERTCILNCLNQNQ